VDAGVSPSVLNVLFDPQTSGGLLVSVSADAASNVFKALSDAGVPQTHIGRVLPPHTHHLVVM
jgi:selenide, water dikinase